MNVENRYKQWMRHQEVGVWTPWKRIWTEDNLPYEEGTWTPVLSGDVTAGTNTYSIQAGSYHKIGSLVFASCTITLSAKDAAMSGNIYISGLPFAVAGGNENRAAASIGGSSGLSLAAGYESIIARFRIGGSAIDVYKVDGGNTAAIFTTEITNAASLILSGSYRTAA